jgi:hypothetical protein
MTADKAGRSTVSIDHSVLSAITLAVGQLRERLQHQDRVIGLITEACKGLEQLAGTQHEALKAARLHFPSADSLPRTETEIGGIVAQVEAAIAMGQLKGVGLAVLNELERET